MENSFVIINGKKYNIDDLYGIFTEEEQDILSDAILYNIEGEIFDSVDDILSEIEKADIHSIANGLVDPYTSGLLDWYKEDLHRVYYMEDYLKEYTSCDSDIFGILRDGQEIYLREQGEEEKESEIYTYDLLGWYEKDLDRVYYLSEALDLLCGEIEGFQLLSGGQFQYYIEIVNDIIDKTKEYFEEIDSEIEEE